VIAISLFKKNIELAFRINSKKTKSSQVKFLADRAIVVLQGQLGSGFG
jgi:hypothetical protein